MITNKDKLIFEAYSLMINEELDLAMDIKDYLSKVEQSIKSMGNVKKSLQGLMAIVNVVNLANKGINAFSGDGVEAGGGGDTETPSGDEAGQEGTGTEGDTPNGSKEGVFSNETPADLEDLKLPKIGYGKLDDGTQYYLNNDEPFRYGKIVDHSGEHYYIIKGKDALTSATDALKSEVSKEEYAKFTDKIGKIDWLSGKTIDNDTTKALAKRLANSNTVDDDF